MPGEFDGGHLHAQADAEVRHFVLARKTRCTDLAFNTALAKTAGHQNAVELGQTRDVVGREGFGIDVLNDDLGVVLHASVAYRFVERLVAV